MKGRTNPLKQLPPEVARGINLVLGRGSTTLFMGSVDKNTVTWSLSQRVPQSKAVEMNETFKDPTAAQVRLLDECLCNVIFVMMHAKGSLLLHAAIARQLFLEN